MNTERSGESSSEHLLDPFIRPIGNPSLREPSGSDNDRGTQSETPGELRADQTYQDDISKLSSPKPNAYTCDSNTNQSLVASAKYACVFRVDCPNSPPQRLQLTGDLYTLGSADGCSIRLRDNNVLPLHATIRHIENNVFVESHSQPLIIDGQEYESRKLKNGEILSLGGYRFELLSNQRVPSAANQGATLTNVLPPEVEQALARSTNPHEQEESTDQNDFQDLVAQSRLEACLRRERLCEKREEKITDDIAELKYREEELLKRISRFEAQEASSLEICDQLSQCQAEIHSLRSSLQETQSLNLKRETELQKAKGELEQQLAECLEESEAVLGKYDSDSQTIMQLNSQIEELSIALTDAQQQRDLLELREQLQRREHEQLVRELEKDRDRVIAEQASNQALLRQMEANIHDLESMVASVNDDDDLSEDLSGTSHLAVLPTSSDHTDSQQVVKTKTGSGWIQSNDGVETQNDDRPEAKVPKELEPVRTESLSTEATVDLLLSGVDLAIPKSLESNSVNKSKVEEVLSGIVTNTSEHSTDLSGQTTGSATNAEPKQIERLEVTSKNQLASDGSEIPEFIAESPVDGICGQLIAIAKHGSDRISTRLINFIRNLSISEGNESDRSAASNPAIFIRFAFAFIAVVAGLISYRLVPGQVRYLAVFMALVLAAIYTSECVTIAKSRSAQ